MEATEEKILNTSKQSNLTGKTYSQVTILCCNCQIPFCPSVTRTNICPKCLVGNVDITTDITKQGVVNYCRLCTRYQRPPWIQCEWESRELLALCLKKINGLNKVRLVDANFLYTEPHSKRIKVQLKVAKEIVNNTDLQQTVEVEFIIHYTQCEDCKKTFTPHTWGAKVQVRQKVAHKKTFLYLEQLILKNHQNEKFLQVKEEAEGLDFFFKTKSDAFKLVQFLQGVVPVQVTPSQQFISSDDRNNTITYKYSYMLEIPKICKEDLVMLPNKLAKQMGGSSNVLICYKVSSVIHLLDPVRMQRYELNATTYFQNEERIQTYSIKGNATEFMVKEVEKFDAKNINTTFLYSGLKFQPANIEVVRTSDWEPFFVKTHLGDILKDGDLCEGFDLTSLLLTADNDADITSKLGQDVFLVAKKYPPRQRKKRVWKLKRLDIDEIEIKGKSKKEKGAEKDKEKDYDEFLDEIENNLDLRNQLSLYRDDKVIADLAKELALGEKHAEEKKQEEQPEGEGEKKQAPQDGVKLEDLLEEEKVAEEDLRVAAEEIKENDELVDNFLKTAPTTEPKKE